MTKTVSDRVIEVRGKTMPKLNPNIIEKETWSLHLERPSFSIDIDAKNKSNNELESIQQLRSMMDEAIHRYKFRK